MEGFKERLSSISEKEGEALDDLARLVGECIKRKMDMKIGIEDISEMSEVSVESVRRMETCEDLELLSFIKIVNSLGLKVVLVER